MKLKKSIYIGILIVSSGFLGLGMDKVIFAEQEEKHENNPSAEKEESRSPDGVDEEAEFSPEIAEKVDKSNEPRLVGELLDTLLPEVHVQLPVPSPPNRPSWESSSVKGGNVAWRYSLSDLYNNSPGYFYRNDGQLDSFGYFDDNKMKITLNRGNNFSKWEISIKLGNNPFPPGSGLSFRFIDTKSNINKELRFNGAVTVAYSYRWQDFADNSGVVFQREFPAGEGVVLVCSNLQMTVPAGEYQTSIEYVFSKL
ncbi:MAG: hypothetical protein LBM95_08690 [Lactobacillales bacterium]|jgi:hypothetical protein|nr:hypothetical protein [Lactobacillales bacterium]